MNPVVGLDVAKGESQIQAFLDKKTLYDYCQQNVLYHL